MDSCGRKYINEILLIRSSVDIGVQPSRQGRRLLRCRQAFQEAREMVVKKVNELGQCLSILCHCTWLQCIPARSGNFSESVALANLHLVIGILPDSVAVGA